VVCSECGELLDPKRVHVHPGPGAASPRHLPPDQQVRATKRRRKSATHTAH